MKPWEEIAEILSGEVKREISEAYFSEKKALEDAWLEYKEFVKSLCKKEEAVILQASRILIMLENEGLIEEFERITGFPLKKNYLKEIVESPTLRRKLFEKLGKKSFGLTSKSRFIKLFFDIYEDLVIATKSYRMTLKKAKRLYDDLKRDTEHFYKRYDLGSILDFFRKFEDSSYAMGAIEDRERLHEELALSMKIETFPKPTDFVEDYEEPPGLEKIYSSLRKLAQRAYETHQDLAKEILKLAFKKD